MNKTLSLLQSDDARYAERCESALNVAQRNALRRVVRCLFAEKIIAKDNLVFAPLGRSAWLPLWNRHALLFFSDLEATWADTFVNHGTLTLIEAGSAREEITSAAALIDLLLPYFDFTPGEEGVAGLARDMANSVENDALARIHRNAWNADLRAQIAASGAAGFVDYLRHQLSVRDAAILLDQWGSLEGHPFYPTWKSKPDLNALQVAALSPEFNATVTVRIAALRGDMAYIERMPHVEHYHDWFSERFPEAWASWKDGLNAKGLDERAWLPLPIHAWHLVHFVHKEYAAEIEEGVLLLDGPDIETWPTMSFRTMMPRLPGGVPFIKLPVALWLTSEQRSLQAKSIHMGPRISTLIQRILADERGFDGTLEIFPEEVAFHYKHAVRQEDRPGRHLSVAFRASDEAFERSDGLLPVTVASLLTASPVDGRALATELIETGGAARASAETAETWFRRYAHVVTHPVIGIYLLYGIALEAHQQNTSVLFAPDGTPKSLLIRDFGDGRTYAPLLAQRGHTLKPYVHPGILPTVFDGDIEPVRSFVLDACFVCHLHEMALLLTREYGLAPTRLWEILHEETARSFDAFASRVDARLWKAERTAFLDDPWPTRSVLRMHLLNYADYRLQHALPNPLRQAAAAAPRGIDQ
jgi:siderophore synthetase component